MRKKITAETHVCHCGAVHEAHDLAQRSFTTYSEKLCPTYIFMLATFMRSMAIDLLAQSAEGSRDVTPVDVRKGLQDLSNDLVAWRREFRPFDVKELKDTIKEERRKRKNAALGLQYGRSSAATLKDVLQAMFGDSATVEIVDVSELMDKGDEAGTVTGRFESDPPTEVEKDPKH